MPLSQAPRRLNPLNMSRNRYTVPFKASRDAQKRVQISRHQQRKQQICPAPDTNKRPNDLSDSGIEAKKNQEKEGLRNTDVRKKSMQSTAWSQELWNMNPFASPVSSKNSSNILTMLKCEPTYCLTGSKVFWTINEEVAPTGTWRP